MTLEEAIGYVAADELIEASVYLIFSSCKILFFFFLIKSICFAWVVFAQVTPKAVRLRKRYLDANKRKSMRNKPKE